MNVIILNGAVSSGKTTIGKLLVEEFRKHGEETIFFDLDDLVEKRNSEFKWDSPEERLKDWLDARRELAEMTDKQLTQRKSVIVVGPFFTKDEIEGFTKYINKNTRIYQYTLIVPLEERLKRNRSRKYSNPDEDISAQQKEIDRLIENYGVNINNYRPQQETVEDIITSISKDIGRLQLIGGKPV